MVNMVSSLLFFCNNCDASFSLEQLNFILEDIEVERDRISFQCPSCDKELAYKDVTLIKEGDS